MNIVKNCKNNRHLNLEQFFTNNSSAVSNSRGKTTYKKLQYLKSRK